MEEGSAGCKAPLRPSAAAWLDEECELLPVAQIHLIPWGLGAFNISSCCSGGRVGLERHQWAFGSPLRTKTIGKTLGCGSRTMAEARGLQSIPTALSTLLPAWLGVGRAVQTLLVCEGRCCSDTRQRCGAGRDECVASAAGVPYLGTGSTASSMPS